MWYLAIKLTIPGVESPIILALIKMLVNSLYFTMAELMRTGSQVPGYIKSLQSYELIKKCSHLSLCTVCSWYVNFKCAMMQKQQQIFDFTFKICWLVSTYVVCEKLSVMHEPAGVVEILVQNEGEYPLFWSTVSEYPPKWKLSQSPNLRVSEYPPNEFVTESKSESFRILPPMKFVT